MKHIVKRIPLFCTLARRIHSAHKSMKGHHGLKRLASSPTRIVIGASGTYDHGWIATDVEYLNLLTPKHWERYFNKGSIDAILAEHVWEHLTMDDGLLAAQVCFQYLKTGGYLRVAVPDGFHPDPEYIDWVKVGGIGSGADDHRVLYNHRSFQNVFTAAGFKVELLEYFDSDGKFHFVNWDDGAGKIRRSRKHDERNRNGTLKYTSIILDAHKNGHQKATPDRCSAASHSC